MKTLSLLKMIGTISLSQLLLTSSVVKPCLTQSSSMIAQYDVGSVKPADVTFDIARLLSTKDEVTIKPFQKLISKLARAEKSTCDIETESRFVTVSQSITNADENEVTKPLDAIKALYAIRKALCETGARGTQVPAACKKLITTTSYDMSKSEMINQEFTITRSGAIPACLHQLQQHHYFWTSYSNNRQDANAMSQLIRSDVELRNVVMTYRDFQESVNELQEHFEALNRQSATWFETAGRNAQDFFDLQQEIFVAFEKNHANASLILMAGYEHMDSQLTQKFTDIDQLLFSTQHQVSDILKDTSAIQDAMGNMKHNMIEIYSSAAADVAALTDMHTVALEKSMIDLNRKSSFVATNLDLITHMVNTLSQQSNHLSELNSEHLDQLELQHQLATATLTKQELHNEILEYASQLIDRHLVQIKRLGKTVSGITYVLTVVQQYEYIVAIIGIYIAVSVVLAILDSTVISHKTVSNIKATYWAVQAIAFLVGKLDLPSKVKSAKNIIDAKSPSTTTTTGVIALMVLAIVASSVIALVWNYVNSQHEVETKSDLEKTADAPIRQPRPYVRISDSQRRRLESVPRSVRHGTAPPGL